MTIMCLLYTPSYRNISKYTFIENYNTKFIIHLVDIITLVYKIYIRDKYKWIFNLAVVTFWNLL